MVNCPVCGNIVGDEKVCPNRGSEIKENKDSTSEVKCPTCGYEVGEKDFCPNCGSKITKIGYNNENSDNNSAAEDDETTTDKDEKSFDIDSMIDKLKNNDTVNKVFDKLGINQKK